MGPKAARSTVLSVEEEAIVIAFRKYTLLPLDDCLYALQATIPHLTRSSLHRCLQRHGISRLPEVAGDKPARQPFKQYPIGYFHVDIAEVRTEEGKLHLFVAVDRTSKFALRSYTAPPPLKLRRPSWRHWSRQFLIRFTRFSPTTACSSVTCQSTAQRRPLAIHGFDRICREQDIEHRLTKPNHPWTNGQVERMNRTLKDATVRRYHYDTRQQLKEHLAAFVDAYNFAKRLKTLRGLMPYEYICKTWADNPDSDTIQPTSLRD
jgi:hypothetical protein